MKKLASLFALLLLLAGLAELASLGVHAQSGTLGLAACDQGGRFVACSPVALGANAITLPASTVTALTNIVDLRGVKQFTLISNCTQVYSIDMNFYAEDGVTSTFNPRPVVTITGSNEVFVGSESSLVSVTGTIQASGVRLPQRAVAFDFFNTTATPGTCTARLFLAY